MKTNRIILILALGLTSFFLIIFSYYYYSNWDILKVKSNGFELSRQEDEITYTWRTPTYPKSPYITINYKPDVYNPIYIEQIFRLFNHNAPSGIYIEIYDSSYIYYNISKKDKTTTCTYYNDETKSSSGCPKNIHLDYSPTNKEEKDVLDAVSSIIKHKYNYELTYNE